MPLDPTQVISRREYLLWHQCHKMVEYKDLSIKWELLSFAIQYYSIICFTYILYVYIFCVDKI